MASNTPPASERDTQNGYREIKTLPFDREFIFDESKKIRSCEIGRNTETTDEKVFMVVGESGAGKTSAINFMVNYILGVNFDDNYRFRLDLDQEEKTHHTNQSESQTRWITSYKIICPKRDALKYRITIIDSPGYGDTGGKEQDKFTNEQIKTYFTDVSGKGIDHIDAVAFVINATVNRLNDGQKYVFKSILDIFGKDISENFVIFLTHASVFGGEYAALGAINAAEIQYAKSYTFDNQWLFATGVESSSSQFLMFQKMAWDMGCESLAQCFRDLNNVSPKSLTLTREVMLERKSLQITMDALQDLVKDSFVKLHELQQKEKFLKDYENQIDKNKNHTLRYEVRVAEKVSMWYKEKAMVCLNCEYTCHSPCADYHIKLGTTCPAMKWISMVRGCSACPGKCGPSQHAQKDYKYIRKTEYREITKNEMKQLYKDAKTNVQKVNQMSKETELAWQKVREYIEKVRSCLERLNEIALKPDPQILSQELNKFIKIGEQKDDPKWQSRKKELEELINMAGGKASHGCELLETKLTLKD